MPPERLPSWELDFEADALTIEKAGVRCPVHHCTAHVLRFAPCGDPDGDYNGAVHVGRVRAGKRQASTMRRRVDRIQVAFGYDRETAELHVGLSSLITDAAEAGSAPGITTRAMRETARARR